MRPQLWAVLNRSTSPHTTGSSNACHCTRVRAHASELPEAQGTTTTSIARGDVCTTVAIHAHACTTSACGTYGRHALATLGRWAA